MTLEIYIHTWVEEEGKDPGEGTSHLLYSLL